MYHATLAPGDRHHKHRYETATCSITLVSGHGLAGAGADRAEVHAGHFHLIPKGVEHWLVNLGRHDPLVIIGFYDRAPYLKDTGHVYLGNITEADLAAPRTLSAAALQHPLVHNDSGSPRQVSKEEGWTQDYFNEPLNRSVGAGSCWMQGYFGPTPCT